MERPNSILRYWTSRFHAPVLILIICGLVGYSAIGGELGTLQRPQAYMWPALVAAVTAIVAILLIFKPNAGSGEATTVGSAARVVAGMLALAAFATLFQVIGFLVPSALFLLFMVRFLGGKKWAVAMSVALFGSLLTYAMFVYLIGIPVPAFVN